MTLPWTSPNWVKYEEPPTSIPEVIVEGKQLKVVSSQWRINGSVEEVSPSASTDVVADAIELRSGSDLTFEIVTPVKPLIIEIGTFVDSGAFPSEGEQPSRFDCLQDRGCWTQTAGENDVVTVNSGLIEQGGLVVLYVEFATLEEIDDEEGIGAYRASWVVQLVRE